MFEGDIDKDVPPTFEDGKTTKVVPGQGTYTIDPNGKVKFTPEPEFVGTASGVTVVRKDKNGKTIFASYTPTVRPDTIFRDKEGKEIPGYPTEDGTTPKKDIPGYRFVKTENLPNGDVKHVYEKITTPVVEKTTTWVDENRNPLKPVEKGTKEAEKVPGYEFVRTVVDKEGNLVHVFRKVANSDEKVQLKRLANTGTTETNTGLAGLGMAILGGLLAIKRRKNDKK